ncbi:hypothetical protein [Maledivibacter halophilus]|uniref:Sporulation lipoprotein YhcN/YlaJ (Spore_YhcN_YlaJ) n=1 Tax=Maledivibacter halophilus TaxID=36842 RepID=A0A1T5LLN1_9FIRM|nr:hypothetical protein [Maledivibacter halophilus]SKC76820.1 hypothetical protein SAMN02194393_03043 [Maledivibacter halophilus]
MKKIIILVLISTLMFSIVACSEKVNSMEKNATDAKELSKSEDTNELGEKQEASNIGSVYFDYDKERFELIKVKDWDDIILWDKEKQHDFLTVVHWDDLSAEEIVKEKLQEARKYDDELEQVESDLKVESLKLIDYYREYEDYMNDKDTYELVKFLYMYFIDDGSGGVYRIVIDADTFDDLDDDAKKELLEGIKIIPLSENDNMKDIKVLDKPPAKKVAK